MFCPRCKKNLEKAMPKIYITRKIFWAFFVLVIMVGSYFVPGLLKIEKTVLAVGDYETCNSFLEKSVERRECFKNLDIEECKRISPYGEYCYMNIVLARSLDPRQCEKIGEPAAVYNCYIGIAMARDDAKICDNFSFIPYRESCYKQVTEYRIRKGYQWCNLFPRNSITKISPARKECLAGLTVQDCEKLGVYDKNSCYTDIALLRSDTSICNLVDVSERRDSCFYWLEESVEDKSKLDCEIMPEGGRDSSKDRCFLAVAKFKKDLSICENKIRDENFKVWCISNVAASIGDSSICNKLKEPQKNDGCLIGAAKAQNNAKSCNEIVDPKQRTNCYAMTLHSNSQLLHLSAIWGLNFATFTFLFVYGFLITLIWLLIRKFRILSNPSRGLIMGLIVGLISYGLYQEIILGSRLMAFLAFHTALFFGTIPYLLMSILAHLKYVAGGIPILLLLLLICGGFGEIIGRRYDVIYKNKGRKRALLTLLLWIPMIYIIINFILFLIFIMPAIAD